MIWLDVDTAVEMYVNKVPLVASADGYTIDEGIAYNESGMDLNWNFMTTAGVVSQTNVVPTTSGDYDWIHVGNGMCKIEMTASGGASANNDTEGFGWWSGVADAICPFTSPVYGFRAAAINNALVDGATAPAPSGEYDTEMARVTANVATEAKQDIIDTNIDQIETVVITNADGADIAADIIAIKAETATIVADTNELQTDNIPGALAAIAAYIDTEVAAITDAVITNADGADIAADIIALKAETATILDDTDLIDDGTSGLAKIASDIANVLTDTGSTLDALIKDIPTVAEFEARSDAAGTAATPAEVATALSDINLDHLMYEPVADRDVMAEVVDGTVLANLMTKTDGDTSDFDPDTDSLEAIRDHIGDGTNLTEAGGDGDHLTEAGGTGDHFTAIPYNSDWDTDIQSECADALTAYDPPTKAEMDTAHALLATPAQVETACDSSLGTYDGPTKAEMDTAHALLATPADVATELGTYDGPTKAEMDTAHALLATPAEVETACDSSLGTYDGPTKGEMDTAHALLTTPAQVASALTTYDGPTKAEMDTAHALLATPAEVNAEMVDCLSVDTYTEPGQETPAATASIATKLGHLHKGYRNKKTNDGSTTQVYNDAGDTVDQKQSTSEAAGTVTIGGMASGP